MHPAFSQLVNKLVKTHDAEVLLTSHTYLAVQNTAKDIENAKGKFPQKV